MDKRGEAQEETYFSIFTFLAIALLAIIGFINIHNTLNNVYVQQEFLSKDIAMTINEAISLPGDIRVEINYEKKFTVSLLDDKVIVKTNSNDLGVAYPIFLSNGIKIKTNTIYDTQNFVIYKKGEEIYFDVK